MVVRAALTRGTLTDAALVTAEARQHRGPKVSLPTSLPQALCLVSLGVLQLSSSATLLTWWESLVVCPVPHIQAAWRGQPHLLLISGMGFKSSSDWMVRVE